MADPNQPDWRSAAFRARVVNQIEDSMRQATTPMGRSASEMENHVFQKAQSRDEYMALVARLIIHVKEYNSKNQNRQQGMAGALGMGPGPGPHGHMGAGGPPGMGDGQDPMNALKNLARVGGPPPPQQGMMQQGPGPGPQHMHAAAAAVHQRQQALLRGQMTRPTLQRQDAFIVTSQNIQQMPGPGIVSSPNIGFPQASGVNTMNTMGRPGQMGPIGQGPMGQGPMQTFQMQPGGPQGPLSAGSDMSQTSPAPGLPVPSPGSSIIPSPASRGMMGAPSPVTYLNTPGNAPASVPSPNNTTQQSTEEQKYLEKLAMLSKYIEPLKRSVNNLEKNKDEDSRKNYTKMKNLLDILSDPNKRVSMQTLNRCEQALNNWHNINKQTAAARESGFLGQALYDAVAQHVGSPTLNHTLQRTFGPAMSAFLGEGIGGPLRRYKPKPMKGTDRDDKAPKKEAEEGRLPEVLEREVANLGLRFQVALDPLHHPNNKTIHLVCKLVDLHLPSVPPILVIILSDYPKVSPVCEPASCPGYDASNFFRSVGKTFDEMLRRMSDYTLTALLGAWEMSVRKACAPSLPVDGNMMALVM